ncbi:MAG: hypothetical protein HOQ22_01965, partial [Nocardioidaceae bacterium]|nr:hypothetical protein [Nocardioidaceae bacterium]
MTRVFLHIGAPKSGTSYLQSTLWRNRALLREHGLLLPGSRAAHYQAMADLRGGVWTDGHSEWTWDRMVRR